VRYLNRSSTAAGKKASSILITAAPHNRARVHPFFFFSFLFSLSLSLSLFSIGRAFAAVDGKLEPPRARDFLSV